MWHKLNLLKALTAIFHPCWDQDLLQSCQGLLKLESELLSQLPASCSWPAFFILALNSIFSVRNVCLCSGLLPSLNTSFVFTKLQIWSLFRLPNPVCWLCLLWQLYVLSQWLTDKHSHADLWFRRSDFKDSKWKPRLNYEPQNLLWRVTSPGSR